MIDVSQGVATIADDDLQIVDAPVQSAVQAIADEIHDAPKPGLQPKEIGGVTIITHGWRPTDSGGDPLLSHAQAIHNQAGGWFVDYDVLNDEVQGSFNKPHYIQHAGDTDELVLLFD